MNKRVPADSLQGSWSKLSLKPTQVICRLCPELLCHQGRWLSAAAWASPSEPPVSQTMTLTHLWGSLAEVQMSQPVPSSAERQQHWWPHPEKSATFPEVSRNYILYLQLPVNAITKWKSWKKQRHSWVHQLLNCLNNSNCLFPKDIVPILRPPYHTSVLIVGPTGCHSRVNTGRSCGLQRFSKLSQPLVSCPQHTGYCACAWALYGQAFSSLVPHTHSWLWHTAEVMGDMGPAEAQKTDWPKALHTSIFQGTKEVFMKKPISSARRIKKTQILQHLRHPHIKCWMDNVFMAVSSAWVWYDE